MDKADLDATRTRILELFELLVSVAAVGGHIGMKELKEWLDNRLELGEFDRRTIYRDLFLINSITNLSVEYKKNLKAYRVSLFEKLSEPELSIIVNAIISARFNTEQETQAMADKLYLLAGYAKMSSGTHQIKDRIKLGSGADTLDKIETIQNAIKNNMKILFDYRKYTLNKKFEIVRTDCRVSPYKILWQNDRLYLVGNYENNDFSHYRIERICNLRELRERRKPISDIIGYGRQFDEAEYLRKAVGLSRGNAAQVIIKFQNECIGEVFDSLGKNVQIRDNHDGTFLLCDDVTKNKKFTRWLLGFGALAEVIKPKELRDEVAGALSRAGAIYT